MDILSFILGLKKGKSNIKLQEKTVAPSTEEKIVVPDTGFDALSKVIVEAAQSSGGSGEWIGASGSFVPSSSSAIIEHNLGVVPDIFIIYYNQTEKIPGSTSHLLTAMSLSKKLMGEDMMTHGVGYSLLYNPNTDIQMVFGAAGGLEDSVLGGVSMIGNATANTIAVGTDLGQLITGRGEYKWSAFAMK